MNECVNEYVIPLHGALSSNLIILLSSFFLLPQFEIIVDEDSTIGENQLFGTAYCTVGTLLDAAGGGEIQVRGKQY